MGKEFNFRIRLIDSAGLCAGCNWQVISTDFVIL